MRTFMQIDVFTDRAYHGNPVAVVLDADGLDDEQMQRFANWTNLSETTFVLSPTVAGADYRLRIFTPGAELPFAGHPTLGSCHAWLEAGGKPASAGSVVQECGVGNVVIERSDGRLAFAAPSPRRMEPIGGEALAAATSGAGTDPDAVVDHRVLDNGPEFHALWLRDAQAVLDATPDATALGALNVAIAGPYPQGEPADIEVRMFAPALGVPEDPVTGSLNAVLGQWLISAGYMPDRYVASQGTARGRTGRVHITSRDGQVWVGGDCVTCISGLVAL